LRIGINVLSLLPAPSPVPAGRRDERGFFASRGIVIGSTAGAAPQRAAGRKSNRGGIIFYFCRFAVFSPFPCRTKGKHTVPDGHGMLPCYKDAL
jgi:hypothetical protein